MHVRKFEADTLDEALKQIKVELGPDAVILKTVTNKGFKGAFKKKKIEITAAISEKSLTNKMKVDKVLAPQEKEEFYRGRSSNISEKIESYASAGQSKSNYGSMALNKNVQSLKSTIKQGLDDFLGEFSLGDSPNNSSSPLHNFENTHEVVIPPSSRTEDKFKNQIREDSINQNLILDLETRINGLEERLANLNSKINEERKKINENKTLKSCFDFLRALDLEEKFISECYKKLVFEFNDEEQNDKDLIFDFILREMDRKINISMPQFSQNGKSEVDQITVFLSETSSGQTCSVLKIASLIKGSLVISLDDRPAAVSHKVFNLTGVEIIEVKNFHELVSEIRKNSGHSRPIFVDVKSDARKDESKKMIDGLKRAFENVEVILSVSAIHGKTFNEKILNKFESVADGMVINHVDLCLNFSHLFNLGYQFPKIPFYFFGTGQIIPEDLEAASKERILAKIFKL